MSEQLTEDSEYSDVVLELRAINRDRHNRLKKIWGTVEAYTLIMTALAMVAALVFFGVSTAIGVGLGGLAMYFLFVIASWLSFSGSLIMARRDRRDMRAVWRED